MYQDLCFAYTAADFGGSLPDDPVGVAQNAATVPVTLDRKATGQELALTAAGTALAAPLRFDGLPLDTGDRVTWLWRLSDLSKAVQIDAYRLQSTRSAGANRMALTTRLPLTPGQDYELSILPRPTEGGGVALPGGLVQGTRVLTAKGKRAIEEIAVGDEVWTDGHGFRPVLWRGQWEIAARGLSAPLRLRRGQSGLTDDLLIAADHGIRIDLPPEEGAPGTVLAPAAALELVDQAAREFGGTVTYHQLLFDIPSLLFANGLACETLWPGALPLGARPADWPDQGEGGAPPLPPMSAEAAAMRLIS